MNLETAVTILSGSLALIVIPWCVFVTMSIFNQRQEIAILKEIVKELRDFVKTAKKHMA